MLRNFQLSLALGILIGLAGMPSITFCMDESLIAALPQINEDVLAEENKTSNVFSERADNHGDNEAEGDDADADYIEEKISADKHVFNFEEDENDFE